YTRDGFGRNNACAAANIIGNIAHNHSSLREASQDELRLWAFTVHPLQFTFELSAAFVAGVVVAHFLLRLNTSKLRGIRQGPHTYLVFTELFFQRISYRQHERTEFACGLKGSSSADDSHVPGAEMNS